MSLPTRMSLPDDLTPLGEKVVKPNPNPDLVAYVQKLGEYREFERGNHFIGLMADGRFGFVRESDCRQVKAAPVAEPLSTY